MNNNNKRISKLEELISSINPVPLITYIEDNNIFYCFGNANENHNYSKEIEYIFEGKYPEQTFNSFIDLQNHYKTIFGNKNFVLKDLKNIKLEIENIFSEMA